MNIDELKSRLAGVNKGLSVFYAERNNISKREYRKIQRLALKEVGVKLDALYEIEHQYFGGISMFRPAMISANNPKHSYVINELGLNKNRVTIQEIIGCQEDIGRVRRSIEQFFRLLTHKRRIEEELFAHGVSYVESEVS